MPCKKFAVPSIGSIIHLYDLSLLIGSLAAAFSTETMGNKESISNAKKYIQNKFPEEPKPLYGIVNNAGVAAGIVDEEVTIENLQKCLDVNVYG